MDGTNLTQEQREALAVGTMEKHFESMLAAAGAANLHPAKFLDFMFFCTARFIAQNELPVTGEMLVEPFNHHIEAIKKHAAQQKQPQTRLTLVTE